WRIIPPMGDSEEPKDKKDEKTSDKPDFKTTAVALTKEYLDDEKAFEKKYKGKVIEVEGVVDGASKHTTASWIYLVGARPNQKEEQVLPVVLSGIAPQDKAWWLGKGQKVKAVGQFEEANRFFGVTLKTD